MSFTDLTRCTMAVKMLIYEHMAHDVRKQNLTQNKREKENLPQADGLKATAATP